MLRRMSFKKDFVQTISQLGRMPFSTVEEAFAHKELERLHLEDKLREQMDKLPKQVNDLQ